MSQAKQTLVNADRELIRCFEVKSKPLLTESE